MSDGGHNEFLEDCLQMWLCYLYMLSASRRGERLTPNFEVTVTSHITRSEIPVILFFSVFNCNTAARIVSLETAAG
jgi:hypothetical protein